MFFKHIISLVFPLYMCLCQVLSEHPCGENPLRRFVSLTRILNDVYPGREINVAMTLLRESNPELHRRLQPAVTLLQSEWRQYTDCVTMVDNGYFKRSSPNYLSENMDSVGMSKANAVSVRSRNTLSGRMEGQRKHPSNDILIGDWDFIESPLAHDTVS